MSYSRCQIQRSQHLKLFSGEINVMVALLIWYTSKWRLSNFLDGTKFETNKIFWPADQPSKCYKKYRISCVRKYIWYGHYTCTRQHKILLDFVCTLIELGESRIQCTVIHLCITKIYFRHWGFFYQWRWMIFSF